MKKLIALLLCVLSVASLAACGNHANTNGSEIPNPFVDCAAMKDAADIAGFDMTVPESIEGYDQQIIEAIENEMIQVIYKNGDESVVIRKAVGAEDISGDYTEYAESNTVTVGGSKVAMKGNDGLIYVAIWTSGEYTYAICAPAAGMAAETVSALVPAVR